jgi:hypothetical protein
MPRAERSLESRNAEHEKYRRQCQVRIKPSLQLVGIGVLLAAALLWWRPIAWLGAVALVLIPSLITALEYWGFVRHDRAIKRLSHVQDI